jgi:release factor glutamine methyltransferase
VDRRLSLAHADLLSPFAPGCFDLVCANLPYIPSPTLPQLTIFGKEPTLALDGGFDGLELIRRMFWQARHCLRPGGLILAEIEVSLGAAVLELAHRVFSEASCSILQDYTGRDRLVRVELA